VQRGKTDPVTATQVIKQMKALPPRERAKVARFVYANHVPNDTTRKVLAAAEAGRGLVRSKNLDDMMASLNSSGR